VNWVPVRSKYGKNQKPPGRNESFFKVIIIVVRVLLTPLFRIEIEGLKNLPRDSAFILLSKHQRWEDIPLLSLVHWAASL
jgi:1-acyl-sn-glycerol-3-phosphate acyltransferase